MAKGDNRLYRIGLMLNSCLSPRVLELIRAKLSGIAVPKSEPVRLGNVRRNILNSSMAENG